TCSKNLRELRQTLMDSITNDESIGSSQKVKKPRAMKKWVIIGGIFLGCAAAFLASVVYVYHPQRSQGQAEQKQAVDVVGLRSKAEAGDSQAQAQLGDLYAKGEGVTNSYSEAAKWYRLAVEKGCPEAELGLGQLYEAGQGVSKDLDRAVQLYRQAAEH